VRINSKELLNKLKKLPPALLPGILLIACNKSNNNNSEDSILLSQVPVAVISRYNAKYPAATGQVEWELNTAIPTK
jgi:hypothetical protein